MTKVKEKVGWPEGLWQEIPTWGGTAAGLSIHPTATFQIHGITVLSLALSCSILDSCLVLSSRPGWFWIALIYHAKELLRYAGTAHETTLCP